MAGDFKAAAIVATARPRWKSVLFSVVLFLILVAGVGVALLVLEFGVRLNRGMLSSASDASPGAVAVPARPLTRTAIAVHDALLGHIPSPNLKGFRNYEANITTDEAGIRRNGSGSPPPGTPVLAIGDSFTFGLEVDDDGSWPASLERRLARPVINAGVFGYGLDQIVLRGEKLLDTRSDIDTVVLAVFGGDIERCEYSYLFATKPYFSIRDGHLELRNVPVPNAYTPVRLASLRRVLKGSQLADVLFTRLAPSWWQVQGRERREHERGDEVAALLLDRWSGFARQRHIQTLYVALFAWPKNTSRLQALTSHARREGMEVLDLSDQLWAMIQADTPRWQAAAGHLTREGNEWVAAQIAGRLESLKARRN